MVQYDPRTQRMRPVAPLPSPRTGWFEVVARNRVYICGGIDASGSGRAQQQTDSMFCYNPETDTWEAKAPLPAGFVSARAHADAAGGFRRNLGEDIWEPARAHGVPAQPARGSDSLRRSLCSVGDYIVAFAPPACFIYDIAADTWTEAPPMRVRGFLLAPVAVD